MAGKRKITQEMKEFISISTLSTDEIVKMKGWDRRVIIDYRATQKRWKGDIFSLCPITGFKIERA